MVLQLILIQIITFAVIIAILRLLFGSQLKVALNRLQDLQQESMEKEDVLNKEIERARAQCQGEIGRSKEEARLICDGARKNAEQIVQEAVEQAQVQARKLINEAAEHAKSIETSVTTAAAAKSVELAEELVVRIFTERGHLALHAELVAEFLEEFAKIDRERLSTSASKVEVASAAPLAPGDQAKLRELLRVKLGRDITVDEKIDKNILMGVVLSMGGLVVDGSLRNKLRKAMDALRQR